MRIADVMTTPVRTVTPEQGAEAAWDLMQQHHIRHLVVEDHGRVVGILSDRDLGGRFGDRVRRAHSVRDVMSTKIIGASPNTTVREAANLMRGNTIDCLPVFDGERLRGIVTVLDILDLIGRGIDRPVARPARWVMKDRGAEPRGQAAAKQASRAKVRAAR